MAFASKEREREYKREWDEAHPDYKREWTNAHRDEINERKRAWWQENRERLLIKKRAWYQANKEKNKAYNKAHEEEIKAYKKTYQKTHKDKAKAYHKTWARTNKLGYLADGFKWEDVEGYDGWKEHTHVHHRLEDKGFSKRDLVYYGFYFNCQPCDLICMSSAEHARHHMIQRRSSMPSNE